MISIDDISINITKNLHLGKKNIQHMYGCSCCGYEGMLHRHGHYDRNVVTLNSHFIISIQRFICPSCGKTYSLLPSFLIPYFIYSFDVVMYCLYAVFVFQKKATDICLNLHSLNRRCFINIQSISFFRKRFLSKINLINSFFISFDSFYYDSDLSVFSKNRAAFGIIMKIFDFNIHKSFNYEYFMRMPSYFLSS